MNYIEDISDFIFLQDQPQKADIIFIPGGAYPEIAEKAALLWKEGYAPLILPSGKHSILRGYFPGPLSKSDVYNKIYGTEWEFLKDVLVQNGVDEKAILKEDEATNTYQNAIYSKKVTDRNTLLINTAIICCKAFHARRCLMYYQTLYTKTKFLICPSNVQEIAKENWYKSEVGIQKVMGELSRCGGQFTEILKSFMN